MDNPETPADAPVLELVKDDVEPQDITEEPAPHTPPPPPPARVTIAQQVERYAGLIRDVKTRTRLSEGTITRLVELAMNERFTLIQMGLANPVSAPSNEDSDDESSS